jgi:hypothetical protein
MATEKDGKNPAGAGSQHNDWGHSQAGSESNAQSGNAAGTGGVGHRHRDWGHSYAGNVQSGGGESYQGVIPGEEAGELDSGLGGIGSLSTGNAGSMQSEGETESGGKKAKE